MRYYLTLSERVITWMTLSTMTPTHRRTGGQPLTFFISVGQAGIVLNAEKFYFARRIVDFAGFRISDETIEPLPKYMEAIRDFPTPTSTTDIRSATVWHHSNHFSAQGADPNGHQNLKERSKPMSLSS